MTVVESVQHTTPVIVNDELGTAELVSKSIWIWLHTD
jgi:hypothetical protein